MFRKQEARTLDDIDQLLQRQQQLRLNIGLERADYIEKNVELFADGEKFRIFHAEARWNAFFFTVFSYIGGVGALNMFMPHLKASQHIKKYQLPVWAAAGVYYLVSYQVFSFTAGFRNENWKEYNYAKLCRQMRNVQIQQ